MAADGAPEGAWLRADTQTAGRGRLGRGWLSPPGNLYVSGLVRLRPGDPPAPTLALVAGVALCGTLRAAGGTGLTLKWPNDVMADRAKLAGILLERRGDAVACGFGANLAHAPALPGRETVHLAALTDEAPDPQTVAVSLAGCVANALSVWRGAGIAATIEAWLALAHPIGTPLSVSLPDGNRSSGTFAGLDPAGALRLATAQGDTIVHAGDVTSLAAARPSP